MKSLSKVPPDERAIFVRPFVGKRCKVTYGQFHEWTETGVVIGSSHHATNGNSTGDLILAPTGVQPKTWAVTDHNGSQQYETISIALCRVRNIEEA